MNRTATIEIPIPGGSMPAFLALPGTAGRHPAVLVLFEGFGLVTHIEDVARRLAGEGYLALVPDLYHRSLPDNKVPYDQLQRAIALSGTLQDARVVEDLAAALTVLRARADVRPDRIGVLGFCLGGRLAFLAACSLPGELHACASFYGGGIAGHLPLADRIDCPLALFFGGKDPYVPAAEVEAVRRRLGELRKRFTIQVYADADHGFFCDQRPTYHAAAARDAWTRLRDFLREQLD